jgi:hypothetical protein
VESYPFRASCMIGASIRFSGPQIQYANAAGASGPRGDSHEIKELGDGQEMLLFFAGRLRRSRTR